MSRPDDRDLLHDSRRTGAERLVSEPAPIDVGTEACRRAEREQVVSLVDALPRRQREVLTVVWIGELTHREAALRLGIPAGTVKGRIRAGLSALRPVVAESRRAS